MIKSPDINKSTTFNNIQTKILIQTNDIRSSRLRAIFNNLIKKQVFPSSLKMADISPSHKKDETTNKENCRSVIILQSVTKIFENILYNQIASCINKYLSEYLCGFRNGYYTQYSLVFMLEMWKRALDKRNIAGGFLTDLHKAFGCLNHQLLLQNWKPMALMINPSLSQTKLLIWEKTQQSTGSLWL